MNVKSNILNKILLIYKQFIIMKGGKTMFNDFVPDNYDEEYGYRGDGMNDLDQDIYTKENNKNVKVFLGGTCNDSTWRKYIIDNIKIDYFDPVVDDWTEECYQRELVERKICNYCLYVITPRMQGVYSIAEAVDDSNKKPNSVIFCVLEKDGYQEFTKWQLKSLDKVGIMIKNNGGYYCNSLDDVIDYLNNV